MANDNKDIGRFYLDGIMPAKRGVPKVTVSFDINADGILTVTAKDKATGKEQSIRIEDSGKLSQDEIDRIKAEAEKYADADKKAKEEADTINKGDAIIFQNEKMLEEQKEHVTEDEKKKIEGYLEEMKQAVKDKNVSKINELEGQINAVWQEVSMKMYNQQAQTGTTQQSASNNPNTDSSGKVEDAEFSEVS